jgi:ribosomal protein S18 acetylase RimI-like enzyme
MTGCPTEGRKHLGSPTLDVRPVASLGELAAAWRLVADVLAQDDSHPRNYAFYARHFPHRPDLLLVALTPHRGTDEAADQRSKAPGSICGALLAHVEPEYVWIGKLAVAAEYRRCGAGSALLSLAERNAAAAGYRRLMLGAAPEAEAFYARRGYHPELRQPPAGPPQRVFTKLLAPVDAATGGAAAMVTSSSPGGG